MMIDAFAWLEYFKGSDKGKKVAEIIQNNESFTATTTIAEVASRMLRTHEDAKAARQLIEGNSIIVEITSEIAAQAGEIHCAAKKQNKEFGMLDAFVVASAQAKNAVVLTGDEDFKPFRNVIFI